MKNILKRNTIRGIFLCGIIVSILSCKEEKKEEEGVNYKFLQESFPEETTQIDHLLSLIHI